MSELFDKQLNGQIENLKNTSRVHESSHKPAIMVCNENEIKKEKQNSAHVKMLSMEGLIGSMCKSSMIDCKEPQVDDC